MKIKERPLLLIALATAGTLFFAGCASEGNETPPPASDSETTDSANTDSAAADDAADGTPEEPETPAEPEAPSGDIKLTSWAAGDPNAGELAGTVETDSWKVDIYQVGTGETDRDSMFVDPSTNKNILPKGSTVVFFNYVYTNKSNDTITLGSSIGNPKLTSTDWKFASGQPGSSKSSDYEALGLNSDGRDPAKLSEQKVGDTFLFPVAPGESFTQAISIEYKPGVDAKASFKITPADQEGKLVHDKSEEGEAVVPVK